ncbi:ion peptidase N-terminal domain and RING finger protein 1 [Trifolium pratense]|uniref:Ion peptidase N-terminal domain and RING finger protein 1 n=1 Tax=Trifolium pratense TaxID=57577 RepID=A0A2K3NQJ3_TRIPR|nr:ion peptidase N-terminal domain and RING finger protein 1 [Trifolium pratense]
MDMGKDKSSCYLPFPLTQVIARYALLLVCKRMYRFLIVIVNVLVENGPEGLAWDTFHYVYELVQKGNLAFRENRMEEAVNFYSRANSIKSSDPIILGNRSAAYIRISQYLMHRSSSSSEHRPLSGLDPTTLAELGLKDAAKLVELQSNSVKPYLLKANALLLLEKYDVAQDVILSGLQVDPFSNSLRECLQKVERVSSSSTGRSAHGQPERNDDFDCTLCLKLLYEPVTTPCGHSFCRSCLFQSMDRDAHCAGQFCSLAPKHVQLVYSGMVIH